VLSFILHNSYLKNIYGIVRQIIGVGMGTEPAQPAANLVLSAKTFGCLSILFLTIVCVRGSKGEPNFSNT